MTRPEDYIGFLISDVARLMRTAFDRRVRKLGLTRAQWMVITRLHRRPGASQSELADMMEIERASAGRLIDRLEAKGWVERRGAPGDRRVNRIYMTSEAERVHKRLWKVAEATVADALADLKPAEAKQLVALLAKVKGRLVEDVTRSAAPARPADRPASRSKPSRRKPGTAAQRRAAEAPSGSETSEDEEVMA